MGDPYYREKAAYRENSASSGGAVIAAIVAVCLVSWWVYASSAPKRDAHEAKSRAVEKTMLEALTTRNAEIVAMRVRGDGSMTVNGAAIDPVEVRGWLAKRAGQVDVALEIDPDCRYQVVHDLRTAIKHAANARVGSSKVVSTDENVAARSAASS